MATPGLLENPQTMYPVLYSPAYDPKVPSPDRLAALMNGQNPDVHRMVVCTEDSVDEKDVPQALTNLSILMQEYDPDKGVEVFVRARNLKVLDQMLTIPDVDRLAGFVIPKADPVEFPDYADLMKKHPGDFKVLPILESDRMTDGSYRADLLDVLASSEYRDQIDCLRIGGNDLMGHQGIRRSSNGLTIYDTTVGTLIGNIVNEFRGTGGFTITAPVFECFDPKYDATFKQEVGRHLLNRLLGQTVIHPRHLGMLNELYKVDPEDYQSAVKISNTEAKAVEGCNGKMDEKTTHWKWAANILMQAETFGVASSEKDTSRIFRSISRGRRIISQLYREHLRQS